MQLNKRQRGAALITAILITALAAMIATRLAWNTQHIINQRYLVTAHEKTNNALIAARNLEAAKLLLLAHNNNNTINKIPTEMQHDTANILGHKIKSTLIDAESRFNINYLNDNTSFAFSEALSLAGDGMDIQKARALTKEITNWSNPQPNAAFDSYYEKQGLGYIPAHQPFIDSSSLIMLKGFNAALVTMLRPHLIALPSSVCANFNSVSDPLVLKACGLSDNQVSAAAGCRMETVFKNTSDLLQCIGASNDKSSNIKIGTSSTFFLLTSCSAPSDSSTSQCLQSLLSLQAYADNLQINVLWQRGNATMLTMATQEHT